MAKLPRYVKQLSATLKKKRSEDVPKTVRRQMGDARGANGRIEMPLHEVSIVEWPTLRDFGTSRKAPRVVAMNTAGFLVTAVRPKHPDETQRNIDRPYRLRRLREENLGRCLIDRPSHRNGSALQIPVRVLKRQTLVQTKASAK